MRCGGCGSKVGASVLSRVLKRIRDRVPHREEVLVGLDEPDDVAVVALPKIDTPTDGKTDTVTVTEVDRYALVQTVDYFKTYTNDMYTFGYVCALHALSDCFAKGVGPVSAMCVCSVPHGLESKTEEHLVQMLAGACTALKESACALVGGHTCEGDTAMGFSVTGVCDKQSVMKKGGMCVGEKIILTKPLGTGTLLAADMQGKCKGKWHLACEKSMKQSNYQAALCLRRHGTNACTDVTGFGLIGHLVEMIRASNRSNAQEYLARARAETETDIEKSKIGAELYMDALPLIDGALETVHKLGILSTLQPENIRLKKAVVSLSPVDSSSTRTRSPLDSCVTRATTLEHPYLARVRGLFLAERHPAYPLVFDPQTSGGLLASVPADRAAECIAELKSLGYEDACVIGDVVHAHTLEARTPRTHTTNDTQETCAYIPRTHTERITQMFDDVTHTVGLSVGVCEL
eukprot:GDKI01046433.1.p1 GENE.GDKI01046433.1~~GDKI01046433.1.p1  ORF type:complete len:486 (+),score=169.53 GDKI01046433.1:77-1459(+)